MREMVFILEEESAKALLESLVPRILHPEIRLRFIPFEGKQDLERQMVKRMRGYLNRQARFIVLRDQDSAPDCRALKTRLINCCTQAGRNACSLVRIACRELEAFYLADLSAVEMALGTSKLAKQQGNAKFRAPDRLGSPSGELARLTKNHYQKVAGSREIGKHLDLDNQRSPSFKNLIAGIRRMEQELLALPE